LTLRVIDEVPLLRYPIGIPSFRASGLLSPFPTVVGHGGLFANQDIKDHEALSSFKLRDPLHRACPEFASPILP